MDNKYFPLYMSIMIQIFGTAELVLQREINTSTIFWMSMSGVYLVSIIWNRLWRKYVKRSNETQERDTAKFASTLRSMSDAINRDQVCIWISPYADFNDDCIREDQVSTTDPKSMPDRFFRPNNWIKFVEARG